MFFILIFTIFLTYLICTILHIKNIIFSFDIGIKLDKKLKVNDWFNIFIWKKKEFFNLHLIVLLKESYISPMEKM